MSSVIRANHGNGGLLPGAAQRLRGRGHEVEVINDGAALLQRLLEKQPDVLLVGYFLTAPSVPQVYEELERNGQPLRSRIVQVVPFKDDGEVGLSWDIAEVDSFLPQEPLVMFGSKTNVFREWVIVAAVEQLIYRPTIKPSL